MKLLHFVFQVRDFAVPKSYIGIFISGKRKYCTIFLDISSNSDMTMTAK